MLILLMHGTSMKIFKKDSASWSMEHGVTIILKASFTIKMDTLVNR
jgi:hypothetical protein